MGSIPKEGQPLIVGFNWGSSSDHKKQVFNDLKSKIDWNELGSLKSIKPFLKESFVSIDINDYNQTNYCLFRSKKESEISQFDIELSEPIFDEFISRVKPKLLIGFSAKLRDTLIRKGLIKYLSKKSIYDGKKNVLAYHGFIKLDNFWSYIYLLPHPNYWNRINNREEVLKKLWEVCINTNPYEFELADFLNYLIKKGENPQLSEDPLNEPGLRKYIFEHDPNAIMISNISVLKHYKKYLEAIENFDIYDITAVLTSSETDMNKWKNYIVNKKKGISIEKNITLNFDKDSFEWSLNIVKLGLQKLYLYNKYYDQFSEFSKIIKS